MKSLAELGWFPDDKITRKFVRRLKRRRRGRWCAVAYLDGAGLEVLRCRSKAQARLAANNAIQHGADWAGVRRFSQRWS